MTRGHGARFGRMTRPRSPEADARPDAEKSCQAAAEHAGRRHPDDPRGGTLTVDPIGEGDTMGFRITASDQCAHPQAVPGLLDGTPRVVPSTSLSSRSIPGFWPGPVGFVVGLAAEGDATWCRGPPACPVPQRAPKPAGTYRRVHWGAPIRPMRRHRSSGPSQFPNVELTRRGKLPRNQN